MFSNPYQHSPSLSRPTSWAEGFYSGFLGPNNSGEVAIPDTVAEEDQAAFQEGILVGQDAAINGLEIGENCSGFWEGNHTVDLALNGAHGLVTFLDVGEKFVESGFKVAKAGPALATGLAIWAALAMVTEVSFLNTADGVDVLKKRVNDFLGERHLKLTNLYCGVGIDAKDDSCLVKSTRIFRTKTQAIDALREMGRADGFVFSWRLDCSKFDVE